MLSYVLTGETVGIELPRNSLEPLVLLHPDITIALGCHGLQRGAH